MARITITFDDGPDTQATGRVLDILAERRIKATFFLIGNKLIDREARKLAERTQAEGHRVGNHTFSHTVPLGNLPDIESMREITRAQDLLGDLAPERLFRPYGNGGILGPHLMTAAARDLLSAENFTCVTWNNVPRDWEDEEAWVETAIGTCLTHDHSVLVLHDRVVGALQSLPRFLDRLGEAGIEVSQDFPANCLPIVKGTVMAGFENHVAPAAG